MREGDGDIRPGGQAGEVKVRKRDGRKCRNWLFLVLKYSVCLSLLMHFPSQAFGGLDGVI